RQLPVAADLDGEGRVGAAMTQAREVEVGPALGDRRDELLKRRRLAREIDKDSVGPDRRAHRLQAVLGPPKALALVGAGPADKGRRLQGAVEGVTPGVVGAADQAAGVARRRDQPHAAMAADIVEDAERAV